MAYIEIEQDGIKRRTHGTFFRGPSTNFYPQDFSLERDDVIPEYVVKGWMPEAPFVSKTTPIVAFGSCFASNISRYLTTKEYNVLTQRKGSTAYITTMGDGIVNTFAILQQFEWAWENKTPKADLWHGYSAESFGYDDKVRLETKALFDAADCFIITLGLSEIWYDEPTGEVFWRAVPKNAYDPSRHKFRVSTLHENYTNLVKIYNLIRRYRPNAAIVLTVSPIPLTATFRPIACITANSVSKAVLRLAVDQLTQDLGGRDGKCFYFPSYEIVNDLYNFGWKKDRRHLYPHVLNFNMKVFERYFCDSGLSDADLLAAFRESQTEDQLMGREGHPTTMEEDAQDHARKLNLRAEKKSEARQLRLEARKEARKLARLQPPNQPKA